MTVLSSGLFWGGLIVLIGLSIIANVIFGVKIPLFRVIIGLLLIWWGVSLIVGGFRTRSRSRSAVFTDSRVTATETDRSYEVVFGRGVYDFTGIKSDSADSQVEVNTVFGASVIKVNPDTPVKVEISSAFGGGHLPDGNLVAFGEMTWKSDSFVEGRPHLFIKAAVVFGSTEVTAVRP